MAERFFSASSASGCVVSALDLALLRLAGHQPAFLDLTKNSALLFPCLPDVRLRGVGARRSLAAPRWSRISLF